MESGCTWASYALVTHQSGPHSTKLPSVIEWMAVETILIPSYKNSIFQITQGII